MTNFLKCTTCLGPVNKKSKSGLCYQCWLNKKRLDSPYIQGIKERPKGGSQWKNPYGQTHYEINKKEYINKAKVRSKEIKDFIYQSKLNKPCLDCGVIYPPCVMEYDHLDNKLFNVSEGVRNGYSLIKIQDEIKKCELVCSNCHKLRSYNRMRH